METRGDAWRLWVLVFAIIAIITVLILWLVPVMNVTYTEEEPYQAIETYVEKEPYTTTETYYETESYTRYEDYSYTVSSHWVDNCSWWEFCDGGYAKLNLKNTEYSSGAGYFRATFDLRLSGGARTTMYDSESLDPGEEQTFEVHYTGAHIDSFTYDVNPPTKQVTDLREVPKTREVTKYRDVEKTRDVLKMHEVKKTKTIPSFEYWFDYP